MMVMVSSDGISLMCNNKESVLFWVEYIINRGGVPYVRTIEK